MSEIDADIDRDREVQYVTALELVKIQSMGVDWSSYMADLQGVVPRGE